MFRSVLALSVCLALAAPVLAQQADESDKPTKKRDPRDLPIETGVVEEVAVELAEVSVLVTDRRGNPITDLRPEEITVFERGKPQRLAFLDNVGGTRFAGRVDDAPPPAAVYDRQGQMIDAGEIETVLPARAIRRVVLAFDVKNSKLNIREKWRQAAEDWVRNEMQDDDLVGVVVFRSYPFWLVYFSNDKPAVLRSIEMVSLDQGIQDRDKGRDVSRLVEDIHSLCTDLGRASDRSNTGSGRTGGSAPATDEKSCAYNLTEPQVQQWDMEANETLGTLRGLTGQLAAVPGRKMVILFSEGWVSDAATAGTQAMVAVFGVAKIDTSVIRWSLERDALRDVNALQLAAKAANVSYFTIDTTRGYDTGFGGNLERGQSLAYQNQGINPWSEMNWETRQTLNALAKATGGRSYHGAKDLDEKMTAAADSFFGYYLVGYYRSDPRAPAGRNPVAPGRGWPRGTTRCVRAGREPGRDRGRRAFGHCDGRARPGGSAGEPGPILRTHHGTDAPRGSLPHPRADQRRSTKNRQRARVGPHREGRRRRCRLRAGADRLRLDAFRGWRKTRIARKTKTQLVRLSARPVRCLFSVN